MNELALKSKSCLCNFFVLFYFMQELVKKKGILSMFSGLSISVRAQIKYLREAALWADRHLSVREGGVG